jgi:hypothetical protein
MKNSWLSNVEPSRFEEFLQVLWRAAQQGADDVISEAPPDGVGERQMSTLTLSYALDRSLRFAAMRWYVPDPSTRDGPPLRMECFFLSPASSQPRVGLRMFAPNAQEKQAAPPAWWQTVTLGEISVPSGASFPGFLELVAVLASKGNVATTTAEMQTAIADLTYDLNYYRQLSSEQADELRQLQSRVREVMSLQAGWAPSFDEEPEDVMQPPPNLDGLPAWALAQSDRITILPRALNGAKKSLYENPAAVYGALELLAGPYRAHRLGELDKQGFTAALSEAGLQLAGSVGSSIAGSHGEDYFVTWRGRRRFLEMHLLKGGGRDERYCLRIYFFWDDATGQAIVGWLPSHLNNSLS